MLSILIVIKKGGGVKQKGSVYYALVKPSALSVHYNYFARGGASSLVPLFKRLLCRNRELIIV